MPKKNAPPLKQSPSTGSSNKKKRISKAFARQMAEGYKAMAGEQAQFADMALKIAHEVLPEWK